MRQEGLAKVAESGKKGFNGTYFLLSDFVIKPCAALCCRLKWALDGDEATPPHGFQHFCVSGATGVSLFLLAASLEIICSHCHRNEEVCMDI